MPSSIPARIPRTVEQELLKIGFSLTPSSAPPLDFSLVVPAFNEQLRLAPTLRAAWEFLRSRFSSYEIIVVDDGSTDATAELASQFSRLNPAIRLIQGGRNRGKGAAVRLGISNAHGSLVMYADADGASRTEHLDLLLSAVNDGADVAIGSRATTDTDTQVYRLWHRHLVGQAFNFLANRVGVGGIQDTQCGFKLFRAEAARAIIARQIIDGYAFDVEILLLARRLGYRISEVPIDWSHIAGSKVNVVRDSARMFKDLIRIGLKHRVLSRSRVRHGRCRHEATRSLDV